jgi:hypothetical protein
LLAAIAQAATSPVRFLADSQPRGVGKHVLIDANPSKFGATSTPTSISFLLPHGWRLDARAVSKECTPAQAAALRCPRASRIGYGHVVVHLAGYLFPGGETDAVTYMTAFLGHPEVAGDPASMVLVGQWLGIDPLIKAANQFLRTKIKRKYSITGRIIRLTSGKYGLEVRWGGMPGGLQIPPQLGQLGVSAAIRRFKLEVGQVRRVRQNVTRVISTPTGTVTIQDHILIGYHLISRPVDCPGSNLWPWQLRFGGQRTVSGTVKCDPSL